MTTQTCHPHVAAPPASGFDLQSDTLIVGAGACGMTAALAASEASYPLLLGEKTPSTNSA